MSWTLPFTMTPALKTALAMVLVSAHVLVQTGKQHRLLLYCTVTTYSYLHVKSGAVCPQSTKNSIMSNF